LLGVDIAEPIHCADSSLPNDIMKPRIDDPQDATDDESSEFDDIEHVEPLQNSTIKQLKCEVKEYEERMNLKGESVMKEIEERHAVDEKVEGQDYAMKSYKKFSRDGELESSRLEIQSPYLKDTLRTVIKHYPGVSLRGDTIILLGPLRCIFHYRKELEGYRQKVGDRYAKLHIHLLLRFMGKELRSSIRGYEANVGTSISNPAIEYKDLWMVFLPGESLITGQDEMNQILSLVSTTLIKANCGTFWRITGRCFTHDGTRFGYTHKHINIQPYEGTKTIRDFPILPLRYYDTETVIQRLR